VLVRVTDHVNLLAMNDTTICQEDAIQLRVISDGFQYSWSPPGSFIDPLAKNPICITQNTTHYKVIANIGSCSATDDIIVNTIPYPIARAGADTMICHGDPAQLKGYTDGQIVQWTPSANLSNPSILNPVAWPPSTTTYVLSAFDNKGCPKPGRDTIIVNVLPQIKAYAGHDTSVVVGQPLQLWPAAGSGTMVAWHWLVLYRYSQSDRHLQ
jgi:hypothetical protein